MYDKNPPRKTVKLVFIHHSCGSYWLADDNGRLGAALKDNNYFVSDTNYGWGPDKIGDTTDIGHWWLWFRSGKSEAFLNALFAENGKHCGYEQMPEVLAGENEIVMFKSCYPNSELKGSPNDPIPDISVNPLRGKSCDSPYHTISNAKGIYLDLLGYFKTRQDKLFVAVTAPPVSNETCATNARLFNNWLVKDWLKDYPYKNVGVFDFYNVLTSNGGSPDINDIDDGDGNHHWFRNGAIRHIINKKSDTSKYVIAEGDDHPGSAGNLKATREFVNILNIYFNKYRGS